MKKELIDDLHRDYIICGNGGSTTTYAAKAPFPNDVSSAAINLGAAFQVVVNFLDFVANHERPGQFTNSPDYVAARCVIERLLGREEPAA